MKSIRQLPSWKTQVLFRKWQSPFFFARHTFHFKNRCELRIGAQRDVKNVGTDLDLVAMSSKEDLRGSALDSIAKIFREKLESVVDANDDISADVKAKFEQVGLFFAFFVFFDRFDKELHFLFFK